jgi:hypothetical protein
MIDEKGRSNPLNLMRVMPPKEGPNPDGQYSQPCDFPAHGFFVG